MFSFSEKKPFKSETIVYLCSRLPSLGFTVKPLIPYELNIIQSPFTPNQAGVPSLAKL